MTACPGPRPSLPRRPDPRPHGATHADAVKHVRLGESLLQGGHRCIRGGDGCRVSRYARASLMPARRGTRRSDALSSTRTSARAARRDSPRAENRLPLTTRRRAEHIAEVWSLAAEQLAAEASELDELARRPAPSGTSSTRRAPSAASTSGSSDGRSACGPMPTVSAMAPSSSTTSAARGCRPSSTARFVLARWPAVRRPTRRPAPKISWLIRTNDQLAYDCSST